MTDERQMPLIPPPAPIVPRGTMEPATSANTGQDELPEPMPVSPFKALEKHTATPMGQALAGIQEAAWEPAALDLPPEMPGLGEAESMVSRPLYDIAAPWWRLVDFLTERGGEMDEESIAAWDQIQEAVPEKLDNCIRVIRTLDAYDTSVKDEKARFAKRKKTAANQKERMREYVKDQMIGLGMEKHKSEVGGLAVRTNAPKCNVLHDGDKVPAEFYDVQITMTGVGWQTLSALLKTAIPSEPSDLWGGVWKVEKIVDEDKVVKAWEDSAGVEQIPGTVVGQSKSLIVR